MRIIFCLTYLFIFTIAHLSVPAFAAANLQERQDDIEVEKSIIYPQQAKNIQSKYKNTLMRKTWVESARGSKRSSADFFVSSGLCLDLGNVVSERIEYDEAGRVVYMNQEIHDPTQPDLSQQRLLANIEYNEINLPVSYREEIFITAEDKLTNDIIRLWAVSEIYKVQYNNAGEPSSILGNAKVIISNDKGETLLSIKGSFTKKAQYGLKGELKGYLRYGIEGVKIAEGVGEVILSTPPAISGKDNFDNYRVGIVEVNDETCLREILSGHSFISQLLSKFGLTKLFYRGFFTKRLYAPLTYLQIDNTPEEIMSLKRITLAFKNLIKERERAYANFEKSIDSYYDELSTALFDNLDLWWDKDTPPQEYYAGDNRILSKLGYRKMIDDAICSLSMKAGGLNPTANLTKQILTLEQHLRTQMIVNSKLVYIENLKNAVFNMNNEIGMATVNLERPVIIYTKDAIEAVIGLPEKKRRAE